MTINKLPLRTTLVGLLILFIHQRINSQPILVDGKPGHLEIRRAGEHSIRITLNPEDYKDNFPFSPGVADRKYPSPFINLNRLDQKISKHSGNFMVSVTPNPLTITVSDNNGHLVQEFVLNDDGKLSFLLDGEPVLGMGEGGPKPVKGTNWHLLPVQFDRSGLYDSMQPRFQSDAYGSRNPVAMLIGTKGWAIYVATPWVQIDLQNKDKGYFIPWKPTGKENVPQTVRDQGMNGAKGLPPIDKIIPGLYDFFVFDARLPSELMKDYSVITGPAALLPKWALGYMQSHRTLESDDQMIGIIDTFRNRKIPLDAVIYLGTGFTPRGWNKEQPSFEFNPEVFKHDPVQDIAEMHKRHTKVVLHMVPWDRDKLPGLHGSIPAKAGEVLDKLHIQNYWQQHIGLVRAGVDAFWPDEGDWFNLDERVKRHQLYYQGYLSSNADIRPWSLQRNGYPGIAQWGGWVWSGDVESSWKTLETQIAVGLNYSMSIGPFWGTDIGGFIPSAELTGELYARWFQFGAFCPLFRSHGRTWHTRLPWGWGINDMGPKESNTPPLQSAMNNPAIEPVIKAYDELRYQLLPYSYTLAWEARNNGMPMMRALWMHYPDDTNCYSIGNQYLWGDDIMIAPVYEKNASSRNLYLPQGIWYDWWTNEKQDGGRTVNRSVDLSIMPIYVRAGAIIPFDPIRQYTTQVVTAPTELRIFTGTDGQFNLYEDDGLTQEYLKGKATLTSIKWNEKSKTVTIAPGAAKPTGNLQPHNYLIKLLPGNETKLVVYNGKILTIKM